MEVATQTYSPAETRCTCGRVQLVKPGEEKERGEGRGDKDDESDREKTTGTYQRAKSEGRREEGRQDGWG